MDEDDLVVAEAVDQGDDGDRAEDEQRRVAEQDCFAVDLWGVRRLVRVGDPLPETWRVEDKPVPKSRRAPEPASKTEAEGKA